MLGRSLLRHHAFPLQRHALQRFAMGGMGMPVTRPSELLPVGGAVTLAFLICPRCIWEINQAQLDSPLGRAATSAIVPRLR